MKNVIFAGMKRTTLILVALLSALSLAAQEKRPSWLVRTATDLFHSFTTNKKHFDTTYVYQTPLKWTVTLEGERLSPRADLFCDFSAKVPSEDGMETRNGTLQVGLQGKASQKIGLAAGYGSLSLGYGVQLSKKDGERNKYFGFGITSASYGGRIRYYKLHPQPSGTIEYEGELPVDLTSDFPGELRSLAVDAFYAFNRHRFVFNATYSGRHLQRRSAGSWIVTAEFLQGDFSLDPEDPIGARLGDVHRFATRQLSVGGGYSFNWVLFHRDPVDEANGGLRNLTFNTTALPMVSFLNLLYTDEGKGSEKDMQFKNRPTFTPALRSGICYSLDRWSFCAEASYNCFFFRGAEKDVDYPTGIEPIHVTTRGVFHEFILKGKVNFHF